MTNEYKIRLNADSATPAFTGLVFKAGDKGQKLLFTVDELDYSGYSTAKICFMRADGTSVESNLTAATGGFTYTILGTEFAIPGRLVADLKFYSSTTQRSSTASFVVDILGDTLDGIGAGAGGYSDRLNQLITLAESTGTTLTALVAQAQATGASLDQLLVQYQHAFEAYGIINPAGAYASGTQYHKFDLAGYDGKAWVARRDVKGVTPTDGADWQLFATGGSTLIIDNLTSTSTVAALSANMGRELNNNLISVDNDLKFLGWSVPRECPIQNYMDSNRVFHQKVGRVDLGSLSWSGTAFWGNTIVTSSLAGMLKDYLGTETPNLYCANYSAIKWTDFNVDTPPDKSIALWGSSSSLLLRNTTYTDLSALVNSLKGVYLYYELATEILHNEGGEIGESIKGLGNVIGMRGWNQIFRNTLFAVSPASAQSHISVSNGVITFNTTEDIGYIMLNLDNIKSGHKYYIGAKTNIPSMGQMAIYTEYTSKQYIDSTFRNNIFTANSDITASPNLLIQIGHEVTAGSTMTFFMVDLTALFGAGNEPSSVEDFRAMFPADYYPYCSGGFGDLLWTNASPTSAFAGQGITLDLSSYRFAAIVVRHSTTDGARFVNIVDRRLDSVWYQLIYPDLTQFVGRGCYPSDDGVSFGVGSPSNSDCIPEFIYGIR